MPVQGKWEWRVRFRQRHDQEISSPSPIVTGSEGARHCSHALEDKLVTGFTHAAPPLCDLGGPALPVSSSLSDESALSLPVFETGDEAELLVSSKPSAKL